MLFLVGPNGAGKTSLLRRIASIDDEACFVSDERDVFASLTVAEHLRLFARTPEERAAVDALFPRLADLVMQRAATLSGGEQQMLALARAVAAAPKTLLADEPVAGLAPDLVREVYAALRRMSDAGTTVVVAEPHEELARAYADTIVRV
jgi:branched-chain amino acid transport system ATP-binding protein